MERLLFRFLFRLRYPFRSGGNLVQRISARSTGDTYADWSTWDDMLQRFVRPDGKVNYAAWKKEEWQLEQLLAEVANCPPSVNHSLEEQLAYWINLYNAATIRLMLRHYPVTSIRDIGPKLGIPFFASVFDKRIIKVAGISLSLNDIEHRILRKLNEPRMHFAINCASESCPALSNQAYKARKLESQLASQTRQFLNDPTKNKIEEKSGKLSPIFDWFIDDFGGKEGLREKLNKWAGASKDIRIDFKNYNWKSNDAGTNQKMD